MEDQCSPLALPYFLQEEGIEELKHSLLYTTLELENTVVCAREEIAKKDQEILHLKNLLARIVKERDEAMEECRRLGLEKQLLRQQVNLQFQRQHGGGIVEARPPSSGGTTTVSDEDQQTLSSSDSEENNNNNGIVVNVSPGKRSSTPQPPPAAATMQLVGVDVTDKISPKMPLPEKGKFLQAVMEAGPLLQTLLLAGPLPEWQHPPPQLNSIDIPPVTISPSASSTTTQRLLHQDSTAALSAATGGMGYFSKKRPGNGACDSPSPSKYQKAVNHISPLMMVTNIISAS